MYALVSFVDTKVSFAGILCTLTDVCILPRVGCRVQGVGFSVWFLRFRGQDIKFRDIDSIP